MQSTRRFLPPIFTGTLLMALAMAGCGDQSTAPNAGISASEAQDVANVVSTDADAILDASTMDPATGVALAPARTSPPPCTPAKSPSSPANSDGDPVPDSVRFDFSGCAFTRGNFSFAISGLIDALDPTPATTDFGIRLVFTGFTVARTNETTSRTTTAEFNGTRQITGNADALNHIITNFTTKVTLPGGGTVTHVKNWNATFTADTPGSIVLGQLLPSGILNIAGTSQWSRGSDESFALTITTSGLHFNASCTIAPRFDAGSSSLVITRHGETVNVLVQHTACGQYTVTRTPG
jgi:hypothetical protein